MASGSRDFALLGGTLYNGSCPERHENERSSAGSGRTCRRPARPGPRVAVAACDSGTEALEKKQNSAMLAAHWLSQAIAQLHGIPDKRERRTALRHKLVDIQARISEEMSSFSHPLDVKELVEAVEKAMAKASLIDKLFIFASLSNSPDPEELAREAAKAIGESPLASLFPTSHMDHEGKVVHRTEGRGRPGEANDAAIANQIAQAESIRRQIAVAGRIDPARQMIVSEHFLSDDGAFVGRQRTGTHLLVLTS
jgi:hypothetical protein